MVSSLLARAGRLLQSAVVLGRSGLLGPYRPDKAAAIVAGLRRYGPSPAAGYAIHSALDPDRTALADERGRVSFAEAEQRTTALAGALVGLGLGPGHRVGVLARNHRGFVEVTVALAKIGADAIYLNTGFSGPQLGDVVEREGAAALVLDDEFVPVAASVPASVRRILSLRSAGGPGPDGDSVLPDIETLIAGGGGGVSGVGGLPRRPRLSRQVILTSGTTGSPRGAHRSAPTGVAPLVGFLSRIPMRRRDTTLVAAPMFHAWGLAHLALGLVFGSTLVLRRRFDPVETLRLVEEEHVTVLAAVPVMLHRIMELPEATRTAYDTSSLRVIALSGSVLPGDLASRAMDAFGDVVYNLYGSTEVAWVSIATPEDLRVAPGTAGRPPLGTTVSLRDDTGNPVPPGPGQRGRIFAANSLVFEGYTDGGTKEVIGGLMRTGDVGHFDAGGRLFVDGRDDDMIVSGGENVFPREVEDLLADHPAVAEVCVVGRPDEEFGARLEAFVVPRAARAVTERELAEYVRARLARFKVPRRVVFVERLPRNATGKVLKRDLPGGAGHPQSPPPAAPSGETTGGEPPPAG
jgi:fatty-acyl-CoA synthase